LIDTPHWLHPTYTSARHLITMFGHISLKAPHPV
jgi:hypothetical protein